LALNQSLHNFSSFVAARSRLNALMDRRFKPSDFFAAFNPSADPSQEQEEKDSRNRMSLSFNEDPLTQLSSRSTPREFQQQLQQQQQQLRQSHSLQHQQQQQQQQQPGLSKR
jgi:hypothetical protein